LGVVAIGVGIRASGSTDSRGVFGCMTREMPKYRCQKRTRLLEVSTGVSRVAGGAVGAIPLAVLEAMEEVLCLRGNRLALDGRSMADSGRDGGGGVGLDSDRWLREPFRPRCLAVRWAGIRSGILEGGRLDPVKLIKLKLRAAVDLKGSARSACWFSWAVQWASSAIFFFLIPPYKEVSARCPALTRAAAVGSEGFIFINEVAGIEVPVRS
jgi:hypothetical protein